MPAGRLKSKRDYRTLSVRYTPELYALTVITTATALMWVPYVIARLTARGISAIANRDPGFPAEPAWAERASRAHANAIENLAVFAPLVLIGAVIGVSTPATVLAAKIFVAARWHLCSRNSYRSNHRFLCRILRNSGYRCSGAQYPAVEFRWDYAREYIN